METTKGHGKRLMWRAGLDGDADNAKGDGVMLMYRMIGAFALCATLLTLPGVATHTNASAPLIPCKTSLPAASYFQLPASVAGPLAPNPREGSGFFGCPPPLANYQPGPPAVYLYQVKPPIPTKQQTNGFYQVSVYKTAADAQQANLASRDKGQPAVMMNVTQAPPLPIAHPVAANEWLRGYETAFPYPQSKDCYAIGGVFYRNIAILAQIDNVASITPPGLARCQTSYKWTTRVLAALYTRAMTYKAPPPVAPAKPVPPVNVSQRNAAARLVFHQVNDVVAPCVDDFYQLHTENQYYLQGRIDLSTLLQDASAVKGECVAAAQGIFDLRIPTALSLSQYASVLTIIDDWQQGVILCQSFADMLGGYSNPEIQGSNTARASLQAQANSIYASAVQSLRNAYFAQNKLLQSWGVKL